MAQGIVALLTRPDGKSDLQYAHVGGENPLLNNALQPPHTCCGYGRTHARTHTHSHFF